MKLKQIAEETPYHQKLSTYTEHYLDIYEKYFREYGRNAPIKLLEIGVNKGGSLAIWQKYFPKAEIHGIDIKDNRKIEVGTFHLGSQEDKAFLNRVAEEYGPFDIVIDDGGHTTEQQITSYKVLFNYTDLYVIEDTCVAYWKGRQSRRNIFNFLSKKIDELHILHRTRDSTWTDEEYLEVKERVKRTIEWIHFYDSIIFIKRANNV